MILALVAVAAAIVYAAHLLRDALRELVPPLRRLAHRADAEHTARLERDTLAAAHASPPRPRRVTREPATASPPPAPARGVLHADTLPLSRTPTTPERSDP